jgi:hypothetical protein
MVTEVVVKKAINLLEELLEKEKREQKIKEVFKREFFVAPNLIWKEEDYLLGVYEINLDPPIKTMGFEIKKITCIVSEHYGYKEMEDNVWFIKRTNGVVFIKKYEGNLCIEFIFNYEYEN